VRSTAAGLPGLLLVRDGRFAEALTKRFPEYPQH
jgi:hypothetical protein